MSKVSAALIVAITVGLWFGLQPVSAQEKSKDGSVEGEKIQEQGPAGQAKAIKPYRLDFSLNEVEDGKTINTRHYSMNLTEGESDEIKIGTRVPVTSGSVGEHNNLVTTQFQYLDVGTRIAARLEPSGGEIKLHVNSDISNIDTTAGDQRLGPVAAPIIRQIKIEGSTLLVVGKPILVGSVDDPNSKRQFQLEVTVTKLGLAAESACTYYDQHNTGYEGKCGTKKGDALHAYCTVDASKLNDQEAKNGKKLYQTQTGCLGV